MSKPLLLDLWGRIGRGLIVVSMVGLSCRTGRLEPAGWQQAQEAYRGAPTAVIQNHAANEKLARSDPLSFLRRCRRHYLNHIHDYRCVFTKRERIQGALSPEQKIEVSFRESPYSVNMRWIANPGRARAVSYVAGRWNKDGRERALVHLHGFSGLLLPGGLKLDIHGATMQSYSRRPVDRFGFLRTLETIIDACERFQHHARYRLTYEGIARLADRPSYLFERRLPYEASEDSGPGRVLLIYVDREWLVPTGCFSYADDEKEELLGSYVLTNVQFNVGVSGEEF